MSSEETTAISELQIRSDERHASTIRELDAIKGSIQRLHDRVDAIEESRRDDHIKINSIEVNMIELSAQLTEVNRKLEPLDGLVVGVNTLTSWQFWSKVFTGFTVVGGALIVLLNLLGIVF